MKAVATLDPCLGQFDETLLLLMSILQHVYEWEQHGVIHQPPVIVAEEGKVLPPLAPKSLYKIVSEHKDVTKVKLLFFNTTYLVGRYIILVETEIRSLLCFLTQYLRHPFILRLWLTLFKPFPFFCLFSEIESVLNITLANDS